MTTLEHARVPACLTTLALTIAMCLAAFASSTGAQERADSSRSRTERPPIDLWRLEAPIESMDGGFFDIESDGIPDAIQRVGRRVTLTSGAGRPWATAYLYPPRVYRLALTYLYVRGAAPSDSLTITLIDPDDRKDGPRLSLSDYGPRLFYTSFMPIDGLRPRTMRLRFATLRDTATVRLKVH